jgi:flagellar FliJ protein
VGFTQQQSNGLSMLQFLEMKAFAEKLEKAIAGQKTVLAGFEQDFQRAQKNWAEIHNKTKNLQKISELAKQDELKIENKREQIELDARAVRAQRKNGI